MHQSYKAINEHSIIGNLFTTALIGTDGSIDWCCMPHIDSPSIFAAILDRRKGGCFYIRPKGQFTSRQEYLKHTNVLITTFKTKTGYLKVTDFMHIDHVDEPQNNKKPRIFRKVECTKGHMDIEIGFFPRFDYARAKTTIKKTKIGYIAEAKGEKLYLNTTVDLTIDKEGASVVVNHKQSQVRWFVLQYQDLHNYDRKRCENALNTTVAFWRSWVNDCDVCYDETGLYKKTWRDRIIRSGLVLKLLTQEMTGAICAAPTTSLPESIGGGGNWDYRFNWIRDASFSVRALYKLGYVNEARKNLEWFMHVVTENINPGDIQIMYGLNGEKDLKEKILSHLSGYRNSKPVRIGNGAAKQKQLDIYGELVGAFYEISRFGIDLTDQEWKLVCKLVDHVCKVWHQKDAGIWEVRGGDQHFVHSKLMCWHAINLALKMAKKQHKKIPDHNWTVVREKIRAEILERGFNKKLNSFVQSYDSDIIDASSLLIPIHKFLPYDDPKVQGTVKAIMEQITTKDGFVYRYKKRIADGCEGGEGAFILCSFWLVDVLAYSGRIKEARNIFLTIINNTTPTGLLAEEINPQTGEHLGNFPQAYSHIGLINSALFITKGMRGKPKKKIKL